MNWLTNYVRPKLQGLVGAKEIPDNLWEKCPNCGAMIYHRELEQNSFICNQCNHHMRINPKQRLEMLFDDGRYNEIELPQTKDDPLDFSDLKDYSDRLKDARKKTQRRDAIVVASGTMDGQPVVIGVFDFAFMGGSMGTAVGEAIIAAVELAILQDASLILVPASGGARMQEGILSLMQMARARLWRFANSRKKDCPTLFCSPIRRRAALRRRLRCWAISRCPNRARLSDLRARV